MRPRPRRLGPLLGLIAAVVVMALTTSVALATYVTTGKLPFIGHGLQDGSQHVAPSTVPTLSLTADQTSVPLGTTVTLTAATDHPVSTGGYQIDIVNTGDNSAITPSPCKTSAPCTVTVSSASAISITYRAYVEQSLQSGVMLTSNTVTVTWLPPSAPTTITLTANPPPDVTGTVTVPVGTTVTLTATTDLPVDTAGYQIDITNTSTNKSALAAFPCRKGLTCATKVKSAIPASITYVAYVETLNQGGVQLPSSAVTVTWSPPPPPPSVTLTAKPAPDATGSVHVFIGTTVPLIATTPSKLDNTGYQLDIFDSNGNQIGASCRTGITCTVKVSSTSPMSITYVAQVEQSAQSGIAATSSAITVTWSPFPNISLSVDNPSPTVGQTVTITTTTDRPIDNTGFVIQIVDLTGGNNVLQQCSTGSSCAVTAAGGAPGSVQVEAYVDTGNPSQAVSSSNVVTITWTAPPPPTSISLSASSLYPNYGTTVTLTATTSSPVDNTGYIIQIVDLTDNVTEIQRCTTGTSCQVNVVYYSYASITYEAYVDQGNPYQWVATSSPVTVTWNAPVGLPGGAQSVWPDAPPGRLAEARRFAGQR